MSTRAEKKAFADEMVALLEDQLKATVGAVSIGTDGVNVELKRGLEKELEHWRKQSQRYDRTKSRTSNVDLSGSHD